MDNFIINIGRQLGSGGRAIGHILAREFGIAYYDKEILSLAAKESGFCEEIFAKNDEHKGFFRSVLGNLIPLFGGGTNFYNNQLSEESLSNTERRHPQSGSRPLLYLHRPVRRLRVARLPTLCQRLRGC